MVALARSSVMALTCSNQPRPKAPHHQTTPSHIRLHLRLGSGFLDGWGILGTEFRQLVGTVAEGLDRRGSAAAQGDGFSHSRDLFTGSGDEFKVAANQQRTVGASHNAG